MKKPCLPLPIDVFHSGKWLSPAERNQLSLERMHWFPRFIVKVSMWLAPNWQPK